MTGCEHRNNHFDRSLCACGAMHTYCDDCGLVLDSCPYEQPDPQPAARERGGLVVRTLEDGSRVAARVQGEKHVIVTATPEQLLSRLDTIAKKLQEASVLAHAALPSPNAGYFAERLSVAVEIIDHLGDELDCLL